MADDYEIHTIKTPPLIMLTVGPDETLVLFLPRGRFMSDSERQRLFDQVGLSRNRVLVLEDGAGIGVVRLSGTK